MSMDKILTMDPVIFSPGKGPGATQMPLGKVAGALTLTWAVLQRIGGGFIQLTQLDG